MGDLCRLHPHSQESSFDSKSSTKSNHSAPHQKTPASDCFGARENGSITTCDERDAASSSSVTEFSSHYKRRTRSVQKHRNCVVLAPYQSSRRMIDISHSLGISFASIIAQVLEKNDAQERIPVDDLSMICTSAIRGSLTKVFRNKADFFVKNFQKSFQTTLMTLRLINESSTRDMAPSSSKQKESPAATCHSQTGTYVSETGHPNDPSRTITNLPACVEEIFQCHSDHEIVSSNKQLSQLAPASFNKLLTTFEKSVSEKARSNDLKTIKIILKMNELELDKEGLVLRSDSNDLKKSELSFQAEKFVTKLEETRHAELMVRCVDSLVAGMLIMSASLLYGVYVHSYDRITEATVACLPHEENKSWWVPRQVSSLSSGLLSLRCQAQVLSRMLFGVLMILAVVYLLLQSPATPRAMTATFILLILGGMCGIAGKMCVDTLGGDGYLWLFYWECLCFLHFFSVRFVHSLFDFLHGPLGVPREIAHARLCPYWFRRLFFYFSIFLLLPLSCGLLPFAGTRQWKDHFMLLAFGSL